MLHLFEDDAIPEEGRARDTWSDHNFTEHKIKGNILIHDKGYITPSLCDSSLVDKNFKVWNWIQVFFCDCKLEFYIQKIFYFKDNIV